MSCGGSSNKQNRNRVDSQCIDQSETSSESRVALSGFPARDRHSIDGQNPKSRYYLIDLLLSMVCCSDNKIVRVIKTYLWDYVILVVLLVLCGVLELIHPFSRYYLPFDESIMYPYRTEDTVPNWALFVISAVVPVVLIAFLSRTYKRTSWDLHAALMALALGLLVTGFLTQLVKVSVGRLRPDFLARCRPENNMPNAKCLGDPSVVEEGRKSFPSGHASLSFAGLSMLTFYILGKLQIIDRGQRALLAEWMLAFLPVVGALMVALSRVSDYRHHWQDVTVGSLLGLGLSYWAYNLYFEPLNSQLAGMPKRSRINAALGNDGDSHEQNQQQGFQTPLENITVSQPSSRDPINPYGAR